MLLDEAKTGNTAYPVWLRAFDRLHGTGKENGMGVIALGLAFCGTREVSPGVLWGPADLHFCLKACEMFWRAASIPKCSLLAKTPVPFPLGKS